MPTRPILPVDFEKLSLSEFEYMWHTSKLGLLPMGRYGRRYFILGWDEIPKVLYGNLPWVLYWAGTDAGTSSWDGMRSARSCTTTYRRVLYNTGVG
jgi:hypothetical protein